MNSSATIAQHARATLPSVLTSSIRVVVVIAHPGHEVCLKRWAERMRPKLAVLTTGSRSGSDKRRLSHILDESCTYGFMPSSLIGSFEDRQVYQLILEGDSSPFHSWADRLRDVLVSETASEVVVDAWQGYSVAHDLTNLLGHVAAVEASAVLGQPISVREFAPVSEAIWPRRLSTPVANEEGLTQGDIEEKIRAARAYPDLGEDLAQYLESHQREALAREVFYKAPTFDSDWRPVTPPYYEAIGEQRARAGVYSSVLRFSHFAVIAQSLVDRLQLATASRPEDATRPQPCAVL